MKPLTLREIKKRNTKNPQDQELNKLIEDKTISKKTFNKIIEESIKQKPFDKNKKKH